MIEFRFLFIFPSSSPLIASQPQPSSNPWLYCTLKFQAHHVILKIASLAMISRKKNRSPKSDIKPNQLHRVHSLGTSRHGLLDWLTGLDELTHCSAAAVSFFLLVEQTAGSKCKPNDVWRVPSPPPPQTWLGTWHKQSGTRILFELGLVECSERVSIPENAETLSGPCTSIYGYFFFTGWDAVLCHSNVKLFNEPFWVSWPWKSGR